MLPKSYSATYYNGQIATGNTVTVELLPDELLIHWTDEQEVHQQIRWQPSQIHENEINDNQLTILKYGDFPSQTLEVQSADFHDELERLYSGISATKSNYNWVLKRGGKGLLAAGAILMITLTFFYWWVLPQTVDAFVHNMPAVYEAQMGKSLYNVIIQDYEIDTQKTEVANDFFKALDFQTTYPVEITVVDSDEKNAFAIMGGQIVILNGILEDMDSYEELAGLLAHEYAHVEKQHSARILCRSLANYLIISLLINDLNGVSLTLLQNAESLKTLSYSRDLEIEADKIGVQMLLQSGIDPSGMADLFRQLQAESEIDIPEFMSTHPALDTRIGYIENMTASLDSEQQTLSAQPELERLWKLLK